MILDGQRGKTRHDARRHELWPTSSTVETRIERNKQKHFLNQIEKLNHKLFTIQGNEIN